MEGFGMVTPSNKLSVCFRGISSCKHHYMFVKKSRDKSTSNASEATSIEISLGEGIRFIAAPRVEEEKKQHFGLKEIFKIYIRPPVRFSSRISCLSRWLRLEGGKIRAV